MADIIDQLLDHLSTIAIAAGDDLLQQQVQVTAHKTRNDLLTENDLRTERRIIGALQEVYPKCAWSARNTTPMQHPRD